MISSGPRPRDDPAWTSRVGFGWSLISAVVAIVAGLVLLAWPLSSAVSLTIILTVFPAIEGIVSVLYAPDHRRELTQRWGFMLLSGIVDLGLAAMISMWLPRHGRVGDRFADRHQPGFWQVGAGRHRTARAPLGL